MNPGSEVVLGLIAGSGEFPLRVARSAKGQGISAIVAVGFKSQTDPALQHCVDQFHYVGVGQLGKLIGIFKKSGVRRAVMAGKLQHRLIFSDLRLDLKTIALLARLKDRRTDSILGAIAAEMQKEGIELIDSTKFLSEELAGEGVLSHHAPSKAQQEDVAFGSGIARELARLDIGQSVAVKDKAVVALEGLEGTDAMIARAGTLAGKGFVIVKMQKPKQDMRFDVPVVGVETLRTMDKAGAAVLAVSAGKTLILNRQEFFALARKLGICVLGLGA